MTDEAADGGHASGPRQPAHSFAPPPPAPLWIRGALMGVQILLIVASFTVTKAVRDAVFLSRFRMQDLAYVSFALAILAGGAIALHQRFVARRFSVGNAGALTLMGVSVSLVGMFAAMHARQPWVPWGLYLWTGIFGLFLVAQFWIMALDIFDVREARRVFPLLAAGASIGGATGGVVARGLSDNLGEGTLLLLVSAVLAVCAVLGKVAWGLRPREGAAQIASQACAASPNQSSLFESARAVWGSPLLRAVALLLMCSIVAGTLLDWQVKAAAKAFYHSDRERMTHFFGKVMAFGSIAALVLQLVAAPLLRRLGVGAALLILPTTMLGGALLFLGQGEVGLSLLAVAVIAKTSEMGVRFSIDKPALELLYMPVPNDVRVAGKGLVDTVADRLGGALTAVIWLTLQMVCDVEEPANLQYASITILVIVAIWVIVAINARRHYLNAFRTALTRLELHPERMTGRVADPSQRAALQLSLTSARPAEVLLALDILADSDNRAGRVDLRAPLRHRQPNVRARALEVLTTMRDERADDVAAPLLTDPSPGVRVAAVTWALSLAPARRARLLASGLAETVRMALELATQPASERMRHVAELARSAQPADRAEAAVLAGGIRDRDTLGHLREDPDGLVARTAIAASASHLDRRDLPFFVRASSRRGTRGHAIAALSRFGVDPELVAALSRVDIPEGERAGIAEALARTHSPEALQPLMTAVHASKGVLRHRLIRALEKLARDTDSALADEWILAELRVETQTVGRLASDVVAIDLDRRLAGQPVVMLARRAADEAIERGIERIFRLVAMGASSHEVRDAYSFFKSATPRNRATCVEYLDNVLPPPMRSLLLPIIEPVDDARRFAAMMSMAEVIPPENGVAALVFLTTGDDPWLRAVTSATLLRLGWVAKDVPQRDLEDDPRVLEVLTGAAV